MIEVNLIPDVKLELLRANRQRRTVISFAILLAIGSLAVVVLLAFYAFGVQTIADSFADSSISSEGKKLTSVEDLSKTLTIQKQLNTLSTQHDDKKLTSRLFDILDTTIPSGENVVAISRLALDTDEHTVSLECEARNGYEALEVFKKTIQQTKFQYSVGGEAQDPINIASNISDGERRYGENSAGQRVLRFSLTFTYPDELFAPTSQSGKVIAPNKQNATDSARGVPKSLFTGGQE